MYNVRYPRHASNFGVHRCACFVPVRPAKKIEHTSYLILGIYSFCLAPILSDRNLCDNGHFSKVFREYGRLHHASQFPRLCFTLFLVQFVDKFVVNLEYELRLLSPSHLSNKREWRRVMESAVLTKDLGE